MPSIRYLHRDQSLIRAVCDELEQHSPLTMPKLVARLGISTSYVCKCLQFLMDEGYVQRLGKTSNRSGMTTGAPQLLYARTRKPLPQPASLLPAVPSAQELCDVMNAMCRQPVAQ